jgi:SAM-dependent methyltransferase
MRSYDIGEVLAKTAEFRSLVAKTRKRLGAVPFEWYPYDSLANFAHLDRLLTGERRSLTMLAGDDPILDIGCADGQISFFLESLGFPVRAIDRAATSHNSLLGFRSLKAALRSKVEVHELDLDTQFSLPGEKFGLTLFLGLLYHLKNPFYVLEAISRVSRYCLLSTRIAGSLPDGTTLPPDAPLAYLLEAEELNRDNSNFWIFSDAGLRRLLRRTNWDICDYLHVGDPATSRPDDLTHDARVFCLLESRYGLSNVTLESGWHQPEESGWRWTKREFAFRIRLAGAREGRIIMDAFIPDLLVKRFGSIRLRITVDGQELRPEIFAAPGGIRIERALRLADREMMVQCELSGAMPPDVVDRRERGIVIGRIDIE